MRLSRAAAPKGHRVVVRVAAEHAGLAFALLALLVLHFVLPLPNTIALRLFLIAVVLGVFGYRYYRDRPSSAHLAILRPVAVLYAVLSLWILFGAILLSSDPVRSFAEINAHWLRAFLMFAIGIGAATLFGSTPHSRRLLVAASVGALMIHVVYLELDALITLAQTGDVSLRMPGLTNGPDKVSFMTNLLCALVLADLYFVSSAQKPVLLRPVSLFVAVSVICLLALYLGSVRNGIIAFVVSLAVGIALYLKANAARFHMRHLATVCMALLVAAGLIYASAESDKRWAALAETIPIALDTERHKAWLDARQPLPQLPDGQAVNDSNYRRIAWAKEGLQMVADHPLGVGYDRNAFGRASQAKYGLSGAGSTHSGLLDMFIATGVPGGLLWLALLFSVLKLSLDAFRRTQSFYALALFFVVLDFSLRMTIDGIVRDHIFQQFMLFAGLLAGITALECEARRASVAEERGAAPYGQP